MVAPLLRSLCSTAARKSLSSSSSFSANYRKSLLFSRSTRFTRLFSSAAETATSPSTADASGTVVDPSRLRNVAVIAHVDHGKTTLMDRLLRQCGADIPHERALDSITLERERGITIASKVTSIPWKGNELNMVDTPGHAYFGGEVERVVGMVEGAILVVDAGEGPLAQTKFVLAKALKYGLRPLLLLNKVDRSTVTEERCSEVESLVFDLFANLGATEEQLEFPVLYASAKEGWASSTYTKKPSEDAWNMSDLLDAIIRHVPPPKSSLDAPFQMLVSMMERDNYVCRILTGRINSGILQLGDKVHGLQITDSGTVKTEEGKLPISLAHSASSQVNLEESIREAVEDKAYTKIPDLLNASKKSCQYPNTFLFLSTFSESHKIRVIDDILQSFIPIRPRFRPHLAYSSLLSYTLEGPNPLPLALAIVQRMLRSGCLPAPQTHLTLSKAWLDRRKQSQTVHRILSEMNSIGYSLDCGTCNYLILSLCKVDHITEAAEVLSGMGTTGCIPDLDSYGTLVGEMSELRMTNQVVETVKEMVGVHLLNPRKETVVKAVNAMRANREIWRAVEMIEFLENEGVGVGFGAYESVLEGCLEVRQFVLAGKFVVRMTERGFIPYIRVRQRVFEGLVTIGETELASVVRQRFAELKS
ncbi:hypothetical protein ACS0TY_018177 [Phlomoides rotata]